MWVWRVGGDVAGDVGGGAVAGDVGVVGVMWFMMCVFGCLRIRVNQGMLGVSASCLVSIINVERFLGKFTSST